MNNKISRRGLLGIMGVAGGVTLLRHAISHVPVASAAPEGQGAIFLLAYMSGGWDQLLALDPRDNTDPRFSEAGARAPGGSGITPAYDRITEAATRELLASNPSGVQSAGGLTFGPAVPSSLLAHAGDLSIVRGVAMDTLTHEVGRRYFITGKFPRGLAANGSSITSLVANAGGPAPLLPHMSVSMEAYNEGLPSFASPVTVANPTDLLTVLQPMGQPLAPNSAAALEAFESANDSCEAHELDRYRTITTYREMVKKARAVHRSNTQSLFQFDLRNPTPEIRILFDKLGIATAADLAGPRGRAAIAAQALSNGLSNAVSLELSNGLDDHADWDTDHAPNLRGGLDALGRLIQILKDSPHGAGGSVWSRTTLLLFSEFSRTPLLNVRDGRDHHLASSALVAGPGLRGGQVVGGTSDKLMTSLPIDPASGKVDERNGMKIRPADIHGTLLRSMGVPTTPIDNQNPRMLSSLLRA
jgi:hypothetical protein